MEITVPADDAAPSKEPPGRYQAQLSDGSVVWETGSAVDAVLMAKAYTDLYGFTTQLVDTEHRHHWSGF
jgi:hypothetical protein